MDNGMGALLRPQRSRMARVNTYLNFQAQAEEAFNFYAYRGVVLDRYGAGWMLNFAPSR